MNRLGLRLNPSRVTRLVSRSSLGHSRRFVHVRKELSYSMEDGLGEFIPSNTLRMLAVDYQEGLLNRLNDEVRGTEQENKSVAQTIIDASTDPSKVLAFNYASEALNNSFFLENMVDGGNHEASMSPELSYQIRSEFGSVEQLKSTVGATALGMFSSGWIWLVCDQMGSLAVFPTFGTGTLLVRSRQMLYDGVGSGNVVGEVLGELPHAPLAAKPSSEPSSSSTSHSSAPPPAPSSPASGASHPIPPLHPSTPSRTFSSSRPALAEDEVVSLLDAEAGLAEPGSRRVNQLKVGRKLYPLLCLSVHERVWVDAGYGVWGKEEYAKRFWSVVDWEKVSLAHRKFVATGRY